MPALPSAPPADEIAPAAPARWTQVEYLLTDRLTRGTRKVVYRADPQTADELSFNNGGWVERRDGEVVSISTPVAGEFDASMPPGGWARPGRMREGDTWRVQYMGKATAGGSVELKLDAQVAQAESSVIAGIERRLIRVDYRGYVMRKTVAGGGSFGTGGYKGRAVWSPGLGPVVRFVAFTRGGASGAAFYVDEELELTSLR